MPAPTTNTAALFCADRGALLLLPGFAAALEDDATPAFDALVGAARDGLHVGHEATAILRACSPGVQRLAARKRGAALQQLLLTSDPAAAIDLAARVGLLGALVPEAEALRSMPSGGGLYKDVYTHTLKVVAASPADAVSRLAALLHDIAKPETLTIVNGEAHFPGHDTLGAERAGRRLRALRFDPETVAAVATLVRLHLRANAYDRDWSDSAVRRLRHDAGDQWQRLLDLSAADVTSARAELVNRARRRVQELAARASNLDRPAPVAPLDGLALMERFGRGPGPWIGQIKAHLSALIASGSLDPADNKAAWAAAEALLATRQPDEV